MENQNKLLPIALRCLELGWSIIPVAPDKKPLLPWREFQKRRVSENELVGWFVKYPELQLGVVTGEISNLTIVDMEEGGDFSLIKDKTFKVTTGGRGVHWYFEYDKDFKNSVRLLPLTDVRSEGGYCVTIGSVTTKGPYFVLDGCPVAKMSPATKELLLSGKKPEVPVMSEVTHQEPTNDEIASDIFFLLKSYDGFGPGQRNSEMVSFIGRVLNRIHAVHWKSHAWATVLKANAKNTPPLALNELIASFNSIVGMRTRETPVIDKPTPPQIPVVTDGSDDVKHIKTVAEEQVLNQDDIFPTQMTIFDEVLDGGFSLGDIVIVAAPTGMGKTSLAQDWTMSFIRGEKKAGVLWFSYEVMTRNLWKKFQTMGMTEEDLCVIPAKHSSGNVAWVETKIKEAKDKFKIKVVVIDHLGFLLPKTSGMLGKNMSLNQSSFITQIVRDLKSLAINEEVVIVLPVHMRKTNNGVVDQEAIKDSSGIAQEADCVFLIERERNKDAAIKEYFTEYSKITLSKNRKNGVSPYGWFTMFNQRFIFSERNDAEKKRDDDWENLTKKEE